MLRAGLISLLMVLSAWNAAYGVESQHIVALVIGNNEYHGGTELKKAVDDAEAIAKKLIQLGVKDTTIVTNATAEQMQEAWIGWANKLGARDVALSTMQAMPSRAAICI